MLRLMHGSQTLNQLLAIPETSQGERSCLLSSHPLKENYFMICFLGVPLNNVFLTALEHPNEKGTHELAW